MMKSGNQLYLLKEEKPLSAVNDFVLYRAIAVWRDEIGDEKHESISRSSSVGLKDSFRSNFLRYRSSL